jgi:hypothetical protein
VKLLDQLGSGEGLPIEAIRTATADRTMVAPLLVEAIERCEPTSEVEKNGLFIAFHLLGQWREQSAYRTLARFLRRPDIELILGDATTETCHRVMASVFDGDPRPIYDIIRDSEADEFVRGRIFDALVILVFRGELDRTAVADFLRSAMDELQPQQESAVWDGWQGAIALLGLIELAPLVREAFRRGLIDETLTSLEDFEDDFGGPAPAVRCGRRNTGNMSRSATSSTNYRTGHASSRNNAGIKARAAGAQNRYR